MGSAAQKTDVTTVEGTLRGRRQGDVVTWRGIPYAAPPVGPLRLRAPQPVQPWTGVRDALDWGKAASQGRAGTMLGPGKYQETSEDCLTLNVVAPATTPVKPRPVMVFIHGGAYILGTSATPLYGGISLARKGEIVYVSMNYRLGALGYLDLSTFSTPARPIDSNLGVRDHVAALEWVQRNIASFGGDPENVTIFGESAGGTAVTTLMATPAAQGLFHKVIAESAAPGLVLTSAMTADFAREYIDLLGIDRADAGAQLEALDTKTLGKAGNKLAKIISERSPGLLPFGPVVDGDYIPDAPLAAFENGNAARVPLIIGTNKREGTLFPRFLDALPTNPVRIHTLFQNTDPTAEERVTGAYDGYPKSAAAIDVGGDYTFWKPSLELMEAHSEFAPTYAYRYDFAPRLLRLLGLHATHGSELFAVFDIYSTLFGKVVTLIGDRKGAAKVSQEMQTHWISFARSGSPLPTWPSFDTTSRSTRILDGQSRVENDPNFRKRIAWDGYIGYNGALDSDTASQKGNVG
ncbi:carboxylesterase/lipase family protein [Actinomycetes bacterium M1A6_2h]